MTNNNSSPGKSLKRSDGADSPRPNNTHAVYSNYKHVVQSVLEPDVTVPSIHEIPEE
jgi:hypothetical protein